MLTDRAEPVAVTVDDLARRVLAAVPAGRRALVAVDGPGASGKSTLTAALAQQVTTRPVVVLHADDFFHPPAVRHARGRYSAEGFWLDAFDTAALRASLDHLAGDGNGRYRHASIDHATGTAVAPEPRQAAADALVLDATEPGVLRLVTGRRAGP